MDICSVPGNGAARIGIRVPGNAAGHKVRGFILRSPLGVVSACGCKCNCAVNILNPLGGVIIVAGRFVLNIIVDDTSLLI